MYTLLYHKKVTDTDIPKLDPKVRLVIKRAIETKLDTSPELYGKPLRQTLAGYRKLRVGDYRVIFKIKGKIVYILLIAHRSIAYREVDKRA